MSEIIPALVGAFFGALVMALLSANLYKRGAEDERANQRVLLSKAAAEILRMRALNAASLGWLEDLNDEGPHPEGWQSDRLREHIDTIRAEK